MNYLDPSEYAAFGLSAETSDAWIASASAMIDAHCRRPILSSSYTERLHLQMPFGIAQLTYAPVAAITALQARLSPKSLLGGRNEDPFFLDALAFGLPGSWTTLEPATAHLDSVSGTVTLGANLFGLPYSEIEITYTAGASTVPSAVKTACAQIVKNAQATPALNVSSNKLNTLQTSYFSSSLLDPGTLALLRPFVAERLG